MDTKTFLNKIKERNTNNNYDYSKVEVNGDPKRNRITLICPVHGDFQVSADKHLYRGDGCRKCSYYNGKTRLKQDEFIRLAKIKHGDKYLYDKTEYKTGRDKVIVGCKIHGYFTQNASAHLSGSGCNKCAIIERSKARATPFFRWKAISSSVHSNFYNYDKANENYETINSKVKITCPLHGDFIQLAKKHSYGYGCPECRKKKLHNIFASDTAEFIKKARKIHGDKYDYSKVDYNHNKDYVIVTCKDHGDFKVKPVSHLASRSGCPVCKSSKGEQKIYNFLKNCKVNTITQYSFPNTSYKYDFYLPDLNIMIEYHGEQHYKPIDIFGGIEEFRLRKISDANKEGLCKANNVELIVIPFTKFDILEKTVAERISDIYKYYYKNKYYYNFLCLCKTEGLSPETKPSDVRKYLTYNYFKAILNN